MTGEKNKLSEDRRNELFKLCSNCKHWLRVQSFMGRCQHVTEYKEQTTEFVVNTHQRNDLMAEKETCILWEEQEKKEGPDVDSSGAARCKCGEFPIHGARAGEHRILCECEPFDTRLIIIKPTKGRAIATWNNEMNKK